MIRLRDLADQALRVVADDPDGVVLTPLEIFRIIDAWSDSNPHLKNPSRHPEVHWSLPRVQPLSGEEPVYGDYLLFIWSAHDVCVYLREFESRASLEASLLSGVAFNPFNTYVVPFLNGKAAPFQVTYLSSEGKSATAEKYHQKWPSFDPENLDGAFPQRKVEWLTA